MTIETAIVGNAPLSEEDKRLIATAENVVRFNLTPNLGPDEAAQTSEMFLSASSKQIGAYLTEGHYTADPAFAAAKRLVLPYAPTIIKTCMKAPNILSRMRGRRHDWTPVCENVARKSGKDLEIIPASDYWSACDRLEISGFSRDFVPSSGFLAMQRALASRPEGQRVIHMFGFGFRGWKHHHWAHEARETSKEVDAGRVVLHQVRDNT